MNLNDPIVFQGDVIQGKGQIASNVIYQYLSQYGGFSDNKAALIGILGDLKRDKELAERDIEILKQAWDKACNDENFPVPLMYDKGVSDLLKEKLEDDNDVDG